jgi:hypothetical protein
MNVYVQHLNILREVQLNYLRKIHVLRNGSLND